MNLQEFLETLADLVWGPPMLVLTVGTGLFLTIRLRGLQFRKLWSSLYLALVTRRETGAQGDVTHFQALMTALSATVGTGNIAGVATAIVSGGPGALFWMWVTGLVGMATKFAEALLGVKYRIRGPRGEMSGGPMFYLSRGFNQPVLAALYAFLAAFTLTVGGNMTQSHSIADAMQAGLGVPTLWTGVITAAATAVVILGGIRSIARAASALVPTMIVIYCLAGLLALALHWQAVPSILAEILEGAFSPTAAVGGFAGAALLKTIRYGVARGVNSNESGMGTAGIAAAAAQTRHPVTQALVSMTQTFIDTLVVCSVTGFIILGTGAWKSGASGAALTAAAFREGLPLWLHGDVIVALTLPLFAFSTILGNNYYAQKALEYLFGHGRFVPYYRSIWVCLTFLGSMLSLEMVWTFLDVTVGSMVLPNLIGLLGLSGIVLAETRDYFAVQR